MLKECVDRASAGPPRALCARGRRATRVGGRAPWRLACPGKMGKGIRAVDVEYVFSSVSNQRAYGVSPPVPRVILTPRSAEALLKTGVDAEELRVRDLDSFWEPGLDVKVQRLRHEDYSSRRRDLMRDVRAARDAVVRAQEAQGLTSKDLRKKREVVTVGVSATVDAADGGVGSLVEQEEARLKKIQLRKKQEVEQMLAFEMRQLELQEEIAAKLQAEEAKAERMKRELAARRAEELERSRLKELQRQAQLEFEEKQRRRIAVDAARKDKELAERRDAEEEQRRRDARRKQMERAAKAQALQEQTEQLQRARQAEVEKRKRAAEDKERRRLAKLEVQKAERARDQEEKARRAHERIELNREQLMDAERQRAEEIALKEAVAADRAQRLAEKQQEEFRQKNLELAMMEERRKQLVEDAKREAEQHAAELLQRQTEVDDALRRVAEQKERNLAVEVEKNRLRIAAKLRNAERQKRRHEYEQLRIAAKLDDSAGRIDDMLQRKEEITRKRKEAAIAAKIKRDTIATAMEKIRLFKKWEAADKLLASIQDGGRSLEPATAGGSGGKRKQRAADPRHERAELDMLTPYEQRKAAEAVAIRTARKIQQNAAANGSAAMEYVSPYEAAIEQQKIDERERQKAAKRPEVVPAFASVNDFSGDVVF